MNNFPRQGVSAPFQNTFSMNRPYNIYANGQALTAKIQVTIAPFSALNINPNAQEGYMPGCILAPVKAFDASKIYNVAGINCIYQNYVWQVMQPQSSTVVAPTFPAFRRVGEIGNNLILTNFNLFDYEVPTQVLKTQIFYILDDNQINTNVSGSVGLDANYTGEAGITVAARDAQLNFADLFYERFGNADQQTRDNIIAIISYGFNGRVNFAAGGRDSGGVAYIN